VALLAPLNDARFLPKLDQVLGVQAHCYVIGAASNQKVLNGMRGARHASLTRLEWPLVLGTRPVLALQRHVKTLDQAVEMAW
jgi:hypothetical protein